MEQVDGQAGCVQRGRQVAAGAWPELKFPCLFVIWHVSNGKKIQTIDFRQCAASNALKIAI
jgi:hypothetical protein